MYSHSGIPGTCGSYDIKPNAWCDKHPIFTSDCACPNGKPCHNIFNTSFCKHVPFPEFGGHNGPVLTNIDGTLRCKDGYKDWVPGGRDEVDSYCMHPPPDIKSTHLRPVHASYNMQWANG